MLKLALVLALLFSTVTEVKLVNWVHANPYPYTNCESSFVTVSILSPENKTYDTNNILLNITAGVYPGIFFVGYFVDGGPLVHLAPEKWDGHIFSQSIWLNGLSKGSHNILVEVGAPETPNNVIANYSQIYFTITKDLEASPSPEPSSTPTPFARYQPSELEVIIAVAIIIAVFALGLGLLIHLTRKHF